MSCCEFARAAGTFGSSEGLPLLDPIAESAVARIQAAELNANRFIRTVLRLTSEGKAREAKLHVAFVLDCPSAEL